MSLAPHGLARRQVLGWAAAGAMASVGRAGAAQMPADERLVRLAFIDPLSGPAADVGRNGLLSWQFMAERLSGAANPAGVRFQVAGFDNKGSPQVSLNMLRAAIDQGFRYVVQGNGSGVAAALTQAIERHNQREPHRAVLYLNYAAMDPALTAERCSFWHFRIDADTSMKMRALVDFMTSDTPYRKVYLLNQAYAHGEQFARYFKAETLRSGPGIEVVGEALHPLFGVSDFQPLLQPLRASGAHALVTGNWGNDLLLLLKAMLEMGLDVPVFSYYPQLKGVPSLLAQSAQRLPVYQVAYSHTNQPEPLASLARSFRQAHGEDLVVTACFDGLTMLSQAMADVKTSDAARVAARMSGMVFKGFNGPVQLRADDHQLVKGIYISRWQPVDAKHPVGAEGSGHTFAPVRYYPGSDLVRPPACKMQRF